MSFQTISVKEAVSNINANSNGWFLPAVQRPYVWGSRYESEKYICKLFDSILNGYPIGTLIVWNTDLNIPYREFMNDYFNGETPKIVDKDLWKRKDKWLVYDGQQRLQTLYSCLKYSLNNRILTYNLCYKSDGNDEIYGFEFVDKNTTLMPGHIKMPVLFTKGDDEKVSYRKEIQASLDLNTEQETLFEKRFDKLWSVFVGTDVKSLAFFPIDKTWSEDKVNDVFQRLNTGGVPLSGADLLFSKIKETDSSFEEKMIEISKWIAEVTNGYSFSSNEILQLINLLVRGTVRIDSSKVSASDISEFIEIGSKIGNPLKDFFGEFMFKSFNINNSAIVSKKLAVLPLIVYSYKKYINGINYLKIEPNNIKRMKQYFILSQLNDWNTQGIIESGIREIKGNDFPLDEFRKIAEEKNRVIYLKSDNIENNCWFALKILLPQRLFINQKNARGRYKPEIDHIFPMHPNENFKEEDYFVDVIWNFQPVSGTTNLLKSNSNPLDFFKSDNTKEHIKEYDFLPDSLDSEEWHNHNLFISQRKKRMIESLKTLYNIDVID